MSKEGPSALLPPAPKRPFFKRRDEPLPPQGPSSLLPDAPVEPQPRQPIDEVVAVSPSSLLPDSPGHAGQMREEVVAVSPSELLPPSPKRVLVSRRTVALLGIFLVVAALAVGLSSHVRELFAPTPSALIEQAKQLYDKKQLAGAVIQLNNALQKEPQNAEGRFLIGRTQLALGNASAAETELRRALDAGWLKADIHPELASAMLRQRKYQPLLDEILSEDADRSSNPAQTNAVRGLAHLALGNETEARTAFERSLTQTPEHPDALLGLARIAARNKRLDEADKLIDRALRADARNLDGWLLKGELQLAMKRPAEATKAYQSLLEIYPANVTASLHLAAAQLGENELDGALKHVQAALKGAPRNPQALYMRALIAHRKKDPATARAAVIEAIKANENEPAIQLLAGIILYTQGYATDAQRPLLRMLEKNPMHAQARKLYSAALMRTGQSTRALEVLLPTQQLLPKDAPLLTLIGEAYSRTGNFTEARTFLTRALESRSAPARNPEASTRKAAPGDRGILADLDEALGSEANEIRTKKLLATTLVRLRRYDEALLIIGDLEAHDKNDATRYVLKGVALLGIAELDKARSAFETALALTPNNVSAAYNLAQVDLREGDPLNARRRLERILNREPSNVTVLVALATIGPAIAATDKEILGWLEQARGVKGGGTHALLAMARHYMRTNDSAQALAVVREAYAAAKDDPDVLRALGNVQMTRGEVGDAVNTYSQWLAMRPNSAEAMRMLAKAQIASNNTASASVLLRKVLAANPQDADALTDLGTIDMQSGRLDGALAAAKAAQKIAPHESRPFILEGDTLMAQGKTAQATSAYENALKRRRSGDLAIRMHFALDYAGRGREADSAIRNWISESPDDPSARSYFGMYLLRQAKFREAAAEFEALVERYPQRADALNNLAWALYRLKDKRALGYAQRALELRPNDAAILDTLGTILVEAGNIEAGIDLLRRAVTLAPDVPEVRFSLAQAWIKAGNRPSARKELESLVASYPNFPQRREAQALLEQVRK